ncbi:MAG: hypothetical protein ABI761_09680 [Saprospiraceae bacterium]
MKQLIAIFLFFTISLNYLNVIDLVKLLAQKTDQTELASKFLLEEESEKSKEENKEKQNGEDHEKYLQKHFLKTFHSSAIDQNDFLQQASRIQSLSYKEALIQPPDFI